MYIERGFVDGDKEGRIYRKIGMGECEGGMISHRDLTLIIMQVLKIREGGYSIVYCYTYRLHV